ncbi:MAG TPA: zinc ribbon domain-containing protein [Planctomycetota bacterium]|nr:zinc ribbon domain-containing protein [Planctomycetota bacterium]
MATCSKCGQTMDAQAAFCSRCGTPMQSDWSAAPAPARSRPEPETPAAPVRKSNTALIVVLGILLAMLFLGVLVCGGILYLAASRSSPAPASRVSTMPPIPQSVLVPPAPEIPPMPEMPALPKPPELPAETIEPVTPVVEPDPVADRKIHLTVTAETWREGKKPFAVKDALVALLKHDGIAVVEDPEAKVDAEVVVEFEEAMGMRYKPFGAADGDEDPDAEPKEGDDPMRGTNLHFQLKVAGTEKDKPRFTISQDTELGTYTTLAQGKSLYESVVSQFEESGRPFSLSGQLLGAVLGRTQSAERLKPELLGIANCDLALEALEAGGFKPVTAEDRVYWALAKGDCEIAGKEKAKAVPLLIEYFYRRMGYEDLAGKCSAVEKLGEIGGTEAAKFVEGELKAAAGQRPEAYEEDEEPSSDDETLVELVRAASEMKLRTLDKELTKLCNDPNDKVATAAQRAAKNIGLALPKILPKKIKPKPPEEPEENPAAP